MTAPFLPFTRPSIDAESIAAVADVFRSGQLASGPKVLAFEAALADYLGAGRQVRVMTSATAGLEMALEIAGIGAGDEVIVPAMSFAASANVVARLRAKPVFVDIELTSRNIDAALIEAAIGANTRAIMPVHFDLTVFSFHPNKNMTSIEGGAIATADEKAARLIEQYRFHGIKRTAEGEIDVMFPGAKSNLTDVAAQIGIDQLKRLDGFNQRRRALAERYFAELEGYAGAVVPARGDSGHAWHMFQLLIDFDARGITRPAFQGMMAEKGIGIGVHYPCIPGLTYYRQRGYRAQDTPIAARVGRETVTLPLFPAMQDEDVPRVCRALREVLGR